MCLNKICGLFHKSEHPSSKDAQVQELHQKGFEQSLEEVLRMTISIDGKEYLKAKELLQFMGIEIEGVMQDSQLWEELQDSIVQYKLKTIMDSNNEWSLYSHTETPKKNVCPNIHYAFDETIVYFLRKHYTNPKDIHLISIIETAYKQLKKS